MSWPSRVTNVFRSEQLDRELDDELQFHIDARTEDLIESGMTPKEAARQARRRLGNRLRLRESSRETKLLAWLESILQDVRFGLRMLRKNPIVTAAAILSLALTIGASTAAFTLIDALFLRPLPVAEPDKLIYLVSVGAEEGFHGAENAAFSYPLIQRLRETSRAQLDVFGVGYGGPYQSVVFDGGSGKDEDVKPQWISGAAFGILGIRPALGRLLTDRDDALTSGTADHATVLSYDFWMRRFGGNPAILGRKLTLHVRGLDWGRFQIAGVAPKGFSGVEPGQGTDLWLPLTTRIPTESLLQPGAAWFQIRGRLKAGVTGEQARETLQMEFTKFRRECPIRPGTSAQQAENFIKARIQLRSGNDVPTYLRWQFNRPLRIVAAIAGLVLLLACSNVANLLVARAVAREREMALRISIGAGRARLAQQMLIESGMLAAVAGVLGLAFSTATTPAIVHLLAPSDFPAYLDLHLDWRVLTFLAVVCALATILFGLAPALRASGVSPLAALQAGGDRQSGKIGILRPLLGIQVSVCFTVLFLGSLLLLSFHKLSNVDLGFAKEGIILCTLGIADVPPEQTASSGEQLLENTRRLPGVRTASFSLWGLIGRPRALPSLPIRVPGRATKSMQASYMMVSPGFLDTMQIPLLTGRDFVERDAAPDKPPAVIVNQEFARFYFPDENPLGKRFERFDRRNGWVQQEIVGMARDTKFNDLREGPIPAVFSPCLRISQATLEVRTVGDPSKMVSTLKDEIQRANPSVRVTRVTLQSTRVDDTLLPERLLAILAGFFAVVALVLAAVGLYGVLNYSVAQRTREIGIRLALGARHWLVVRMVIVDMILLTGIGVAVGLAGGLALSPFLSTLLFEVHPSDFWSVALPLACLLAASGLAAYPAAASAVRVDPIVALRHQ